MPYHIYIPWMRDNIFTKIQNPKILEIGVDVGQTLLPIVQNFTFANLPFEYTGVDVRKDENLVEILTHFLKSANQSVKYEIENSLEWLPKCEEQYDLILIDGDHNYQTIYEELGFLPKILKSDGIAICDDYQNSKWSNDDLYYSTRETHASVDIATKKPDEASSKKGVKAAIDDFIAKTPGWKIEKTVGISEAVIIRRN